MKIVEQTITIVPSDRMAKARLAKKQNGYVDKRKDKLEVWETDKTSLRKSIDAKCFDCSNKQIDEVRFCTVKSCPLWYVRPFQDKRES